MQVIDEAQPALRRLFIDKRGRPRQSGVATMACSGRYLLSPLFGPDPEKIRDRGTLSPGVIVGIEVTLTNDEHPDRLDAYAVEAGGVVYGIRQVLSPEQDVRLGMPVQLRIDGKHAVIEWGDRPILTRWKTLGTPPVRGITDGRDNERKDGLFIARKKGAAATAEILEFTERTVAFGLGRVTDARCRITPSEGASFEAVIPKVVAPFYASHLMSLGAVLQAWHVKGMMGEKLILDWPAAAEASPGIGVPPTPESAPRAGILFDDAPTGWGAGGDATDRDGTGSRDDAPASPPAVPAYAASLMSKFGVSLPTGTGSTEFEDVVPWDLFVKVNHHIEWNELKRGAVEEYAVSQGVPPGEWKIAHKRWYDRMSSDMTLMTKFGQIMSKP